MKLNKNDRNIILRMISIPTFFTLFLIVLNMFGSKIPLLWIFSPFWVPAVLFVFIIFIGLAISLNLKLKKLNKKNEEDERKDRAKNFINKK